MDCGGQRLFYWESRVPGGPGLVAFYQKNTFHAAKWPARRYNTSPPPPCFPPFVIRNNGVRSNGVRSVVGRLPDDGQIQNCRDVESCGDPEACSC